MVIRTRDRNLAFLVAICFFMENLDATIVTTAAPRLGQALHVPSESVSLLVSAYLVTFAMGIPIGGWLVTRFGERRVFVIAIVIFTGASLLCALSGSFSELVVARTLQGVGAALMVPVGRLVVLANAAKTDIMRLVAFIVWPGLLAPVLAPFVGGVIVTFASWPWLFLLNVPIGVGALLAALRMMPHQPSFSTTRSSLDVNGMSLVCLALGGLVYSAFVASQTKSSWILISLITACSLTVLVLAVFHLLQTRNPFVDLRVLTVRSLRESLFGISLFIMTVGAVPMLLPLLFQNRFGWSPIKSGSLVLFVFVGNIGAKPATTSLLNRYGHRRVLIYSTSGVALTMLLFSQIDASTSLAVIALLAVLNGIFRSVGYSAYMTLGFADVSEDRMSAVNVLSATVQQVFAGFAIAASVVALRLGLLAHHWASSTSQGAFSFEFAFILLAIVGAMATVEAFLMHPNTGEALRKSTRRI
jgi:EmrB/QacA subfamily drug resistance transporter